MGQEMTVCQKMLLERYGDKIESKRDEMTMLAVGMGAKSFGFEDDILEFLNDYPEAAIPELEEYAGKFFPEIEIVDNDELDDEED